MTTTDDYHYLVIGLGITGLSVVDFLAKKDIKVSVTDTRDCPPMVLKFTEKYPAVSCYLGGISVPDEITHLVVSPGVPLSLPEIVSAKKRGIHVLGDIELFAQYVDKPVVAITGSNGKSTVTTLVGDIAKANGHRPGVGGNLGTPALSLLERGYDSYILELSSFQLETVHSLRPAVAVILNLSDDHLDRYDSMIEYQQAKMRIYHQAKVIIYNRDDLLTKPNTAANKSIPMLTFGIKPPITDQEFGVSDGGDSRCLMQGNKQLLEEKQLSIYGEHNVCNVLAAFAIAKVMGYSLDKTCQAVKQFPGLTHRCEFVGKFNDVLWINDSKATNVGATLAALSGLSKAIKGKWVIILGGDSKGANLSQLEEAVVSNCHSAILIGIASQSLSALLSEKLACYFAKDMKQAVQQAIKVAESGDGVLLSPACSSLDMFTNFKYRGEAFKQAVSEIVSNETKTECI